MDKRLLSYYNRELQHLRSMSGEFAKTFPKIAGRLALDEFACADPYVERLLEGFAFMAARVQLKLDAEFPRFTQSLLETVYPNYLAPTPSMAVVRFDPDLADTALAEGVSISRGTSLRSVIGRDDRTACEYRTAHQVTLWPLHLGEAKYYTRELGGLGLPSVAGNAQAGICLRLNTPAGMPFSAIALDQLSFFLRGADAFPAQLCEQIFAHTTGIVVRPGGGKPDWQEVLPASALAQEGYDDDQSLFPVDARTFQGYRLLREYFAFHPRFLFFRLEQLAHAVRRCESEKLEIILLLKEKNMELDGRVDASNFDMFCTPVINLFSKRADRIHLSGKYSEHHVVPDRTRPLDFEVFNVLSVTGQGVRANEEQTFRPFYASSDFGQQERGEHAYFAVNRVSRMPSAREKERGRVFLSLVDGHSAPYQSDLRQLSIETLCTNRDLPLQMAVGRSDTDFNLDINAPVQSIRCVAGPTPPRPAHAEGEVAWRAISHLSLNYLSLADTDGGESAAALRSGDAQTRQQIEGVLTTKCESVTRRLSSSAGPPDFVRGLEVTVEFSEAAFEGTGVFLLGAVLARFFAKYVSINSFVETVVTTREQGEIMRWPARTGTRQQL